MNIFRRQKLIQDENDSESIDVRKSNICIITLTYNRPTYIERSFESLYKRAGCDFDHYVFDDNSDKETSDKLKELKEKYGYNLFFNKERYGIYKSFYWNLRHLPLDYEYYVKLDSDVEFLSDNMFPEMIENFKYPERVGGITVRAEGVRNIDRYDSIMQFYGGHAIKNEAPIVYGCCMMFSNLMFKTFKRLNEKELEKTVEKWGIDSILLDHAKKIGKFLIIEDLSVYHIDNTYGQRKINDCYFTDRKRWKIIDSDEVWFMKASKLIYPKFLNRSMFDKIKKYSSTFEEFIENCKIFLKDETKFEEKVEEKKNEENLLLMKKQPTYMKKIFRITSPLNFSPDKNMKHGENKLFAQIPIWAKNNPRFVIEEIDIDSSSNLEIVDEKIASKVENINKSSESEIEVLKTLSELNVEKVISDEKQINKCDKCEYTTSSLKWLKKHIAKNHS